MDSFCNENKEKSTLKNSEYLRIHHDQNRLVLFV